MKIMSYIEKDPETGMYIATVPSIPGAHTQAKTLDELNENLKESTNLKTQLAKSNADYRIEIHSLRSNQWRFAQEDGKRSPGKQLLFATSMWQKTIIGFCHF